MLRDKYSGNAELRKVLPGRAAQELRKKSDRGPMKTPKKFSKANMLKDVERLKRVLRKSEGGAVLQQIRDKYGESLNSRTVPQAIAELKNMANNEP
jgi:hypothetical protein